MSFFSALPPASLIVFRESLEAGLVSAIILAYLRRSGRSEYVRYVYWGVLGGFLASVGTGAALSILFADLGTMVTTIVGIAAGLLASGVLTYMVLWAAKHASHAQERVERRIDEVLSKGYASGIAILAFSTVLREGIEAVLFLFGLGSLDIASAIGGTMVGLMITLGALYLITSRMRRMRLGTIFKISSVLLVIIASGMILHSSNELSHMLASSNVGGTLTKANAFDLGIPDSSVFSDEGAIGGLLSAFTGYVPAASWLACILYLMYWAAAGSLVYRAYRGNRPPPPTL